MAPLRIPDAYQKGLEEIHALSDDAARELRSAVGNAPLTLDADELRGMIASRIGSIPRAKLDDILDALMSLYSLRARLGAPPEDVARDISRAVDKGSDLLRSRLDKLLDAEPLYLVARANNLRFENERSLTQTRILTDMRPMFGLDPTEGPEAMVVVHTLRISFLDADNRYKDFLVALDTGDIRALEAQLERAKAKAASLKLGRPTDDIPYLDVD